MPVRLFAAALLVIEAIGLAALLAWQIVAIVTGDIVSLSSAIALIVLTALGMLAVVGFAVATLRRRSAGRSGGIVVQALIIAVAIGAVTGDQPNWPIALALGIPALLTGVLLFLAAREAAAARSRDDEA